MLIRIQKRREVILKTHCTSKLNYLVHNFYNCGKFCCGGKEIKTELRIILAGNS